MPYRFPDQYCCPLFLDPVDPLFTSVGEKFLQKIIAKYGTNHIYFSDPFNEVQPHLAEPDYLRNASLGIYNIMKSVDSNAVWLLQAWMFVKNPFWRDDLLEAFLTAVPKVLKIEVIKIYRNLK
jgi:alpha-N-acetylglucosaminidase